MDSLWCKRPRSSRKVGMEPSRQRVGFSEQLPRRLFVRISSHFRLGMQGVLLDAELELVPLLAAIRVFRLWQIKASEQVILEGLERIFGDGLLQCVALIGGRLEN